MAATYPSAAASSSGSVTGRLAGEALADVGRGPAVDRVALEHQLGPLAALGAAREHEVGAVSRAHDARQLARPVGVAVGGATSATSLTAARWKSIARSRCASACG